MVIYKKIIEKLPGGMPRQHLGFGELPECG